MSVKRICKVYEFIARARPKRKPHDIKTIYYKNYFLKQFFATPQMILWTATFIRKGN